MNYKIDEDIFNKTKNFEIKIGSRGYGQTYYALSKLLLKLKFNVSSKGFEYWITAIKLYSKNYKYDNTIEKVYYEVAKIHRTTRTRVERAMRTSRLQATEEIQENFNYYTKLTNKIVLELLSKYLFTLENSKHIPRID